MNGFAQHGAAELVLWVGDPDCQTAHDAILGWLAEQCSPFRPSASVNDKILRGNVGESIAFCVAYWHGYDRYRCIPANAWRPFNPNSAIDFDLTWLHFDDGPTQDFATLQEVKTTGVRKLQLADDLVDDYDKLFGDNPRVTLASRFQYVKNKLEYEYHQPSLVDRLNAMLGNSPQTSTRLRLLPTLVHERNGTDPQAKMLAVRQTLLGRGWAPNAVEAWSIALSDLNQRVVRLAIGRN
jgi:hypothetical protein